MQYSITTAAALVLPALSLAKPLPLAPCGPTSVSTCVCPPGTNFQNSTTYATIGGRFSDVNQVTGSFHKVDWMGITIANKTGVDTKAGATRTFDFGETTHYLLTEQLFEIKTKRDSAHQKFGQVNIPVVIPPTEGNGTLWGFWNTIDSTQNKGYGKEYETSVTWNSYRCVTGNPFDYVTFFESALKNTTAILQSQGKLRGQSSVPYTVDHSR